MTTYRTFRVRNHDLIERAGHWVHLVNTVLLVLSGMQIHYATLRIFGSMNTARLVHFVDMYVFFFIGVFHVYQFFATGKWAVAGPTVRNMRGFGKTLKYYLFLTPHKPVYGKYNPLQILTYFLLFGISLVMAVLGFALYWPQKLWFVVDLFGGSLMTVRQWHYELAWVFTVFTAVHLYLIATQPRALTKSMVTGWYLRRVKQEPVPPGEG
jgi:Ni/Fe-hydrogenase 1 B-type cytochrome subunit